MFARSLKTQTTQSRIKLITSDRLLDERLRRELSADKRFSVDVVRRNAVEAAALADIGADCSVLVVDLDPHNAGEITSLETIIAAAGANTPVIVISEDLGSDTVRRLLHLKVADWLPRTAIPQEVQLACDRALSAIETAGRTKAAKVSAFYPAMGGVGNTTLAAAASFILAKGKRKSQSVCIIDLDLQSGTLAEYLDLPANIQLDDLISRPERLDSHLLEVLLSRHASGIALLAAPNTLTGFDGVSPDLIARLLDLVAAKFDNLVIDLPRIWLPWSESVLQGSDHFFVVTDLSVPGLRQARRVTDELHRRFGVATKGRVIVNKLGWLGTHGVKKSDAFEALGDRLAGFVSEADALVNQSRNSGVPLSEIKKSNRVEKDLEAILTLK